MNGAKKLEVILRGRPTEGKRNSMLVLESEFRFAFSPRLRIDKLTAPLIAMIDSTLHFDGDPPRVRRFSGTRVGIGTLTGASTSDVVVLGTERRIAWS
jgi:hypothetical protein